jgi:hypothetical protein
MMVQTTADEGPGEAATERAIQAFGGVSGQIAHVVEELGDLIAALAVARESAAAAAAVSEQLEEMKVERAGLSQLLVAARAETQDVREQADDKLERVCREFLHQVEAARAAAAAAADALSAETMLREIAEADAERIRTQLHDLRSGLAAPADVLAPSTPSTPYSLLEADLTQEIASY